MELAGYGRFLFGKGSPVTRTGQIHLRVLLIVTIIYGIRYKWKTRIVYDTGWF
jgi:hypothetical protein